LNQPHHGTVNFQIARVKIPSVDDISLHATHIAAYQSPLAISSLAKAKHKKDEVDGLSTSSGREGSSHLMLNSQKQHLQASSAEMDEVVKVSLQ
jgi:hypothetical protein